MASIELLQAYAQAKYEAGYAPTQIARALEHEAIPLGQVHAWLGFGPEDGPTEEDLHEAQYEIGPDGKCHACGLWAEDCTCEEHDPWHEEDGPTEADLHQEAQHEAALRAWRPRSQTAQPAPGLEAAVQEAEAAFQTAQAAAGRPEALEAQAKYEAARARVYEAAGLDSPEAQHEAAVREAIQALEAAHARYEAARAEAEAQAAERPNTIPLTLELIEAEADLHAASQRFSTARAAAIEAIEAPRREAEAEALLQAHAAQHGPNPQPGAETWLGPSPTEAEAQNDRGVTRVGRTRIYVAGAQHEAIAAAIANRLFGPEAEA